MNWEVITTTIANFCTWEMLGTILNCIKETCTFITSTLVSLIAIYTFYRTFISKKIKFLAYGKGSSVWEGENVSVSIQNWTLSTIGIESISLIFDDKYSVLVKKFDEPFVLEPLKSATIKSDNFTDNPILSGVKYLHMSKKLYIETGADVIISKMKKQHKKKHLYQPTTNFACKSGNNLVTQAMRYMVMILKDNKVVQEIIILKNGSMNCVINGVSALPPEAMRDTKTVQDYFNMLLNDESINVNVYNYSVETLCQN